ncbi:MAG: transposase [Pseudohongiella sp.]|nr:transposase [Pseudohongiella sp.]MDP2127626.1 transposase [Pseudohongiella sp.]
MARRPRHYVSGMPYHICQRGNNRAPCFIEAADQRYYLKLWQDNSKKYGVPVHAYCLMSNHVHILCSCSTEHSISRTMQVVGSTYASYINKKYERTGTLWEGRHRASLIQSGRYLLNCYRYIELNPVRAGMVARPADYPWSSYSHNALGASSWLDPHQEYLALGNTTASRRAAYKQLFDDPLAESDIELFRKGLSRCSPVGVIELSRSGL